MLTGQKHLNKPPIVEAIVDIDCDMPPDFIVGSQTEQAEKIFGQDYPKIGKRFLHRQGFTGKLDEQPEVKVLESKVSIHALLLQKEAENQLIQIRQDGYSFNRLTPYSSLDDYFPEIERTWNLFIEHFSPLSIQRIRLRYINRIILPLENGKLNLDKFLKVGPRLPGNSQLGFAGFVHQQQLVEPNTDNRANVILSTQPGNSDEIPLIFDIGTTKEVRYDHFDWENILTVVNSLRNLKNHIFFDSLTEEGICLFN